MSPKTLPGTVTEPRNIPGSRRDRAIPVMTCIPAVPEPSGRDRHWGEGAQQHFPPPNPVPQVVISAAGASAGLTNTPQVLFASPFSPPPRNPPPSSPARDSLAAHPQTSHLSSPLRDKHRIHGSLLPASVLTRAVNRGCFSPHYGAGGSVRGPGHQAPALQGCLLTWRSSGLFVLLLAGTPRPSETEVNARGGVGRGPARPVCVGPARRGISSTRLLIASEVRGSVERTPTRDRDSARSRGGKLAPCCFARGSPDFNTSPLPAVSAPLNPRGAEVFRL